MNQPPRDPVAYAAKFLWVWAMLPAIIAAVVIALDPRRFFESGRPLVLVAPLVVVAIGFGVHGRSRAAVWAGLVFFSLLGVVAVVGALLTRNVGAIIWMGIIALPIVKLRDALRAMP